jgi:hypothetical protein
LVGVNPVQSGTPSTPITVCELEVPERSPPAVKEPLPPLELPETAWLGFRVAVADPEVQALVRMRIKE